jgi:acetylornithine deacetylase
MAAKMSDIELLRRLVAFDSTSAHSNRPIADFICEYVDGPGFEVFRNEKPDENKVNLVIRVGDPGRFRDERAGLILSGHMDVVPAVEPEWESDPFDLTERDGRLFGRGAADMKGFLALALNLAQEFAEEPLQTPLVLLLTFDEELGLLGAQHFQRMWDESIPLPKNAIIGEPTGMRVIRMHKGHLRVSITLRGRSAHSACPHLGRNAIEPAARVVTALAELRQALTRERIETGTYFRETPYATINVAQIAGGEAVNIIPDRCAIDIGGRVLPGMDSAGFIQRIRDTVDALEDLGECTVETVNVGPPLLAPADSEVHRFMCDLLSQTEDGAASYATDAGVFQQMGIDCVVCGPGPIDVAHRPNEFTTREDLAAARPIFQKAIRRFCI